MSEMEIYQQFAVQSRLPSIDWLLGTWNECLQARQYGENQKAAPRSGLNR